MQLTWRVSLDSQLQLDMFCKHEIVVCCQSTKSRYASMPCSYQTAEGSTDKKCFPPLPCFSALSRLQTPFDSPLCDTIASKLYPTWPTAIIIRYTFLAVKPPRYNISFSHPKQHSICRIHQFCSGICCTVVSAVTIWISVWLSLNKNVVFNFFLLDKPILTVVYIQPTDVSLDHLVTMCEQGNVPHHLLWLETASPVATRSCRIMISVHS